MADPRVFGAAPLDLWLRSGHPCRGASPHDETKGFCATQVRVLALCLNLFCGWRIPIGIPA
ncbi:hypothetical protein [uncultured Porphyromonas sp.]|uniref:hypothetical protein n=1 Tax=uncultured Porphyromonas sp. TaxID=159274 RepID=UPI002603742A|nr:hypothetical protein [uncultured Porphyromonas sp.]